MSGHSARSGGDRKRNDESRCDKKAGNQQYEDGAIILPVNKTGVRSSRITGLFRLRLAHNALQAGRRCHARAASRRGHGNPVARPVKAILWYWHEQKRREYQIQ